MAKIVKLKKQNFETVYVNTNYIAGFLYDIKRDVTIVDFLGVEHPAAFLGDQTQKILDAMGGKDDG